VNGLRHEYQDRINFVIWDYDRDADSGLADDYGVRAHPAFAIFAPDSDEVVDRFFGPQPEARLRDRIEAALAQFER
jgi:thioredoxin-like negative regulator of GroEL